MHPMAPVIEIHIEKFDGKEALYATYPLVKQMNPELEEAAFRHIQDEMILEGYQCVGAFDQDNNLCGMCGFWVTHRFYCGKSIRIENIVVCQSMRNKGIGEALMQWVNDEAKRIECCAVVLDAYVENKRSHDFYLKQDLSIVGLHFMKVLSPPK